LLTKFCDTSASGFKVELVFYEKKLDAKKKFFSDWNLKELLAIWGDIFTETMRKNFLKLNKQIRNL
jgi:hypothetical protein